MDKPRSPGAPPPDRRPAREASLAVKSVRYGIGAVMVAGGIIVLIVNPGGFGVDGFAMAVGGGLSVLMINFLFRLGVSGDLEREEEERARRYFDEHGHWPDEAPPARGAGAPPPRGTGATSPRSARPPAPRRSGHTRPPGRR